MKKNKWILRLIPVGTALGLLILFVLFHQPMMQFYHQSRADANWNANRPKNAIAHLEWLFERSPADPQLCLRLTDAYLDDNNTARAEYTLTRGINANADHLALHQKLCEVYLLQDKLWDAVTYLDELPNPLVKEQLDALRPATPVLDPPPGIYEEAVTLNMTVPEGIDCYLSLEGKVPSLANDAWAGSFALPAGVTNVKAVAVKDGLVSSWVTDTYRIENVIQPVSFSDPALETLLRELLEEPTQTIISHELWDITVLSNVEPTHYASLSDLAHLQNLTELSLYGDGSQVNIAPLSALTGLKKLSLRHFALDTADLEIIAQWTWLEELALPDNRITALDPVTELTALTSLNLKNNNITDASPLGGLTGLTLLDLSKNALTDTAPLTTLNALKELSLSENRLRDLRGLHTLTALNLLDISYNEISDLSPLDPCTALRDIYAFGNPLAQTPETLSDMSAAVHYTLED